MKEAFDGASVLITGGLGFIGSTVARRMVDYGAKVTVLDSLIPSYGGSLRNIHGIEDRVHVNIADVRDEHSMKWLVQRQDYLFNLAGQTSHLDSMNDPYTDLDINCKAQLSILEACRRHNPKIRVVFASTRQLYGAPERLPVDETHPLRPIDVNGINKLAGENYHLVYHAVYGVRSAVLRLTNTYGPRMRVKDARQTFLGIWIKRVVEGKPFEVFGDGLQLRDFNYVEDCVDALLLAASNDKAYGRTYNLGCAEEKISLADLAALLVKVAGGGEYKIVPFPPERKAIDIGDFYADSSRIRAELGWQPRTSLADGLARSVEFYRRERDQYFGEGQ